MDGVSASAFATAWVAGLLSVLSPCVLPLMPAYLSLVSGISVEELRARADEAEVRRRVLIAAGAFVAGFSLVFVVLGASATVAGRWLRAFRLDVLGLEIGIHQIAGLVIIVMGLHLAGVLRIPWLYGERRFEGPKQPTGPLGAAAVGAAFAFGWTPCVGPILGGILTLAGARETVGQGVGLLLVYSFGLGVPFLLAAWSLERFLVAMGGLRRHLHKLEVAAGVLLVVIGALVVTNQLSRLNGYFQFLEEVVVRLEESLL
ncbi:MAG: cytochrome c biogenesis protein CcdA [Deltaproteobacteria bacterium]|nr:cytochrome c biogenesis protein CcdA [Deltaproteobacteria bacterium]